MEQNIFYQDPLFNLKGLDFFNLSIKPENTEWDKFLEDVLLLRYINFRYAYIYKNMDMIKYYLNLLEGFFL
jgi:hypothetical protein